MEDAGCPPSFITHHTNGRAATRRGFHLEASADGLGPFARPEQAKVTAHGPLSGAFGRIESPAVVADRHHQPVRGKVESENHPACLGVAGNIAKRLLGNAVEGEFGDIHSTSRTRGSELFINPLMSHYWSFELDKVASQNHYLRHIGQTQSRGELSLAIETFQNLLLRTRKPRSIPH